MSEVHIEPPVKQWIHPHRHHGDEQTDGVHQVKVLIVKQQIVEIGRHVQRRYGQPRDRKRHGNGGEKEKIPSVSFEVFQGALVLCFRYRMYGNAQAQEVADARVQHRDDETRTQVLYNHDDGGVHHAEQVRRPVLHADVVEIHVCCVHDVKQKHGQRQHHGRAPYQGYREENPAPRLIVLFPSPANDRLVPVEGYSHDGERGNENIGHLQRGAEFAEESPKGPVFEREANEGERHADEAHDDVTHREVENEQVPR